MMDMEDNALEFVKQAMTWDLSVKLTNNMINYCGSLVFILMGLE